MGDIDESRPTISRDQTGERMRAVYGVAMHAMQGFEGAGAQRIDPGALHGADDLLSLYGEEARQRAFVFHDAGLGELGLRYDFTVPTARIHIASNAESGRYCYAGPVFRRPPPDETRPAQFLQVGVEFLGEASTPEADAELYMLARDALEACGVSGYYSVTGDLGLIFALIEAAPILPRWKDRLKRHVWRPARFHGLLKEYSNSPETARGDPLLAALGALDAPDCEEALARMLDVAGFPPQGLRGVDEVAQRLRDHAEDLRARPLSTEIAALFTAALDVAGTSDEALTELRALGAASGVDIANAFGGALDRFERRLEALTQKGVNVSALPFDAEFGRNLEYYDGFTFEFRRGATQLGGGGRYDRLLKAAGAPTHQPAIGAALRPEDIIDAMGGPQ